MSRKKITPDADPPSGAAEVRRTLDAATLFEGPILPASANHPNFRLTDAGLETEVSFKDASGDMRHEWRPVSSWVRAEAFTRSPENRDWGVLIRLKDRDGIEKIWIMPAALQAGDGSLILEKLLTLGLNLAPHRNARKQLIDYLQTAQPPEKRRAVSRIGWHDPAFLLPDETFSSQAVEEWVLDQPDPSASAHFAQKGTLDGWRENLAFLAQGNSRLTFSISAAFAAPLLHLTGSESGGFHWRGPSSVGKSTLLHAAGSIWGGGPMRGFLKSWRATANALEATAAGHCDSLLCLDELGQSDADNAAESAYLLANGQGKSRAGRTGEARAVTSWRVLILSSGEIGLADKIAESRTRRRAAAGQQVRLIDLPADAEAGFGAFEDLHGFENADAFARALKSAASDHFGTPARAFLKPLVTDPAAALEAVKTNQRRFVKAHCPPEADGQVSRAADRFGLVAAAGELAAHFKICPWPPGTAFDAAARCFRDWIKSRGGTEAAEELEIIARLRDFIAQHGGSRFEPLGHLQPTNYQGEIVLSKITNRAGFKRPGENDEVEYLLFPTTFKTEICAGLDDRTASKALAKRGYLRLDPAGKTRIVARLPGIDRPTRMLCVLPSLFEEEASE